MPLNKKELGRLSPEERIKKLRLMEEERRKEVNEIERLIKESMQEIKTEKLAEEIAPEQKAVDISKLFETAGGEKLERTAREEASPAAFTRSARGYQVLAQAEYDYTQAKKLYGVMSSGGSLTEEQRALVDQIGARRNIAESYLPVGEKLVRILDASRMILEKYRKETGLS